VKLFLDSSVLVAASGSATGASHAMVDLAPQRGWMLMTSGYCISEVSRNVVKLRGAKLVWQQQVQPKLVIVPDALTLPRPLLLTAGKDKPVIISAIAARAAVLLTLDRNDFELLLNTSVYGVEVLTPADFLAIHG
jgi:predicted nucleic acid-binding protein